MGAEQIVHAEFSRMTEAAASEESGSVDALTSAMEQQFGRSVHPIIEAADTVSQGLRQTYEIQRAQIIGNRQLSDEAKREAVGKLRTELARKFELIRERSVATLTEHQEAAESSWVTPVAGTSPSEFRKSLVEADQLTTPEEWARAFNLAQMAKDRQAIRALGIIAMRRFFQPLGRDPKWTKAVDASEAADPQWGGAVQLWVDVKATSPSESKLNFELANMLMLPID